MTTPLSPSIGRLRQIAHWIRWYLREVSGETQYERYVAYARAGDPTAAVLSQRQFQRQRMDAREADPREGFRCC